MSSQIRSLVSYNNIESPKSHRWSHITSSHLPWSDRWSHMTSSRLLTSNHSSRITSSQLRWSDRWSMYCTGNTYYITRSLKEKKTKEREKERKKTTSHEVSNSRTQSPKTVELNQHNDRQHNTCYILTGEWKQAILEHSFNSDINSTHFPLNKNVTWHNLPPPHPPIKNSS